MPSWVLVTHMPMLSRLELNTSTTTKRARMKPVSRIAELLWTVEDTRKSSTARILAQNRLMRRLESRWSTCQTTSTSTLSLIAKKLKNSSLQSRRHSKTSRCSSSSKNSWQPWFSAIMPFRTQKDRDMMKTTCKSKATRVSTRMKRRSCSSLTPLITNSCQGGTGCWLSWSVESIQGLMRSSFEKWQWVAKLWQFKL